MNAVEFTTDLSGSNALSIPTEIAAQLPQTGRARVIVLTENSAADETEYLLASPANARRLAESIAELENGAGVIREIRHDS